MAALAEELMEVGALGTTTSMLTDEQMLKTARLKYALISRQAMVDILRNGQDGRFVKIDGMPADAVIVGFSEHYAFQKDCIAIKIYSETFPVVPEAQHLEELELMCSLYQEKPRRGREFI